MVQKVKNGRKSLTELELYRILMDEITSAKSVKRKIKVVFSTLESTTRIDAKLLYLKDEKEEAFLAFSFKGGKKRVLSKDSKGGIASEVRDGGEPVISKDAAANESYSAKIDIPVGKGKSTLACFPLKIENKVIGVLELKSPSFSEKDIQSINISVDFLSLIWSHSLNVSRIEDLTVTDDLTDLFNARYLKRVLEMEVRRSERYGGTFSVIFVDLDKFKDVNDSHGHLVGSRVLVEVGAMMGNSLRKDIDMAFRYGGDEFVMFLPSTDKAGAMVVAQRVRNLIRSRIFRDDDEKPFRITASFGIASFPEDANNREDMVRLADEAMYLAKNAGRDTILPSLNK